MPGKVPDVGSVRACVSWRVTHIAHGTLSVLVIDSARDSDHGHSQWRSMSAIRSGSECFNGYIRIEHGVG